jgi:hypothetical protein
VAKAHPSLDKENRVRTGENQFLEQFRVCPDKRQRHGIAMFRAPLYELCDERLVIRRIAEYTAMPREFESVVLDRIMVRRNVPWTVHRRTRVQIECSQPLQDGRRGQPFILPRCSISFKSYIHSLPLNGIP